MPYIIPESRRFFHGNDKYDISLFKDVEQYGDFRLQVRWLRVVVRARPSLSRPNKRHFRARSKYLMLPSIAIHSDPKAALYRIRKDSLEKS